MTEQCKITESRAIFAVVLFVTVVFSSPAYAYIDPGAGSLILQALAALGVGMLFYIRRITDAVKRLFGISPKQSLGPDETENKER